MNIEIRFADPCCLREWDDYVSTHPEGCLFLTSAWRNIVSSTYGHQPFYLMAIRGSRICGVLPLFLMTSRLFGSVLATTPYASSGAICADGEEEAGALVEMAIQLARECRVGYLELKSPRITVCGELQRHADYVNYRLPLDQPKIMWVTRVKKSTRRAVRIAERSGLATERGSHLLNCFYHVMVVNMRRLGTPIHSKSFYQNILSNFGPRANIIAIKYQDIPIAGCLYLRDREDVVALYGGSIPEYLHLRPNNLMDWEIIKDAYVSGARAVDFGRSLSGSGQAAYKESWGAEAKPLYYEYFLNRQRTIPRIHHGNPRYQLARSVWRHIPLGLTKLLGPHLIKSIP